jgi:hypothetical protein
MELIPDGSDSMMRPTADLNRKRELFGSGATVRMIYSNAPPISSPLHLSRRVILRLIGPYGTEQLPRSQARIPTSLLCVCQLLGSQHQDKSGPIFQSFQGSMMGGSRVSWGRDQKLGPQWRGKSSDIKDISPGPGHIPRFILLSHHP